MKKNNLKKRKGFTLIELLISIAIIGILTAIAVPNSSEYFKFSDKANAVSIHKIIISAIDTWTSDNADPSQKPANLNAVNSQGRRVYEYIGDREMLDKIGHIDDATKKIIVNTSGKFNVKFDKGVLKTDSGKSDANLVYGVLKLDSNNEIPNYETLRDSHVIIEDQYNKIDYKKMKN